MFNAPLTFVDDTVIENNETLVLTIAASTDSSPYVLANTSACGQATNNRMTVTIIDNDVDLRTTKTSSANAPLFGTPFTYTVTYNNNTGAPTVAPLTAHNVIAPISDPVPAGLTFTSWTCTGANGGVCPAASGSGAISGNANLPAGGSITYTVTATLAAASCTAITNTSTITTPTTPAPGFQEGTSVQAGFTSPAPGGTANNTVSAAVTPACADLAITKSNTYTTAQPNDLPADTLTSGTNTTYTLVVTNNGPVAVSGAVVTDAPTSGLTCPGAGNPATLTCSSTVGTGCAGPTYPIADLLGSGITLTNLPPNQSVTLTMTCRVN